MELDRVGNLPGLAREILRSVRARDRDRRARWWRAGRHRASAWHRRAARRAPAGSAARRAASRSASAASSGRDSTARSSRPRCSSVCIRRAEEAGLGRALALGERERQRLQVVVAQHERADLVGHRGKQLVAVGRAQACRRAWRRASAILILTSTSEELTPAELSMASVLSAALQRRLDAAALGDAEIGALADHLGARLRRR